MAYMILPYTEGKQQNLVKAMQCQISTLVPQANEKGQVLFLPGLEL